jgi:putative membrane protein
MAKLFVDEDAQKAFTAAIKKIEAQCAAEVVVKVRHHSGSYLATDLAVGFVGTLLSLAWMLYTPRFAFANHFLLLEPVLVGALCAFVSSRIPWLRRTLTPGKVRRNRVEAAAEGAFYRRGIRFTVARTGILVYISLLEKIVAVVADAKILEALGEEEIAKLEQNLEDTLVREWTATAVAEELATLGEQLVDKLPRAHDDLNELPDEVHL